MNKKADDVVILDVRKVSSATDYLVICSGNSVPHLKAVGEEILRQAREAGLRTKRQEGYPQSRWVVLDFGDVMVHVFHPDLREHYDLEHLWGDAKRVK